MLRPKFQSKYIRIVYYVSILTPSLFSYYIPAYIVTLTLFSYYIPAYIITLTLFWPHIDMHTCLHYNIKTILILTLLYNYSASYTMRM
jgi:hypothetical protein